MNQQKSTTIFRTQIRQRPNIVKADITWIYLQRAGFKIPRESEH